MEAARRKFAEEHKVGELFNQFNLNLPAEYREKLEAFMKDRNPDDIIRDLQDESKQQDLMQQVKAGISEYVSEETIASLSKDVDSLTAWVTEKGVVHVYKVVKVILNILKDYIKRHDPTMLNIIKQVIPSMQTNLFEIYEQQIVNRGWADHEFVSFAWMCVDQLVKLMEHFQTEFADDEGKVAELMTQFPNYIRMLLAQTGELGIEIPQWAQAAIENVLSKFEQPCSPSTSSASSASSAPSTSSTSSAAEAETKQEKHGEE